jgi:hypothetical protein
LYLDGGKLSSGGKGFGIGGDGLPAFAGSGIDGWIQGQVFYFHDGVRPALLSLLGG